MAFNIGFGLDALLPSSTSTNTTGTSTQRKVLSQEGIDKLVQDVLGSDQGLAALAQGSNITNAYGSTTNALLAQDLVVKLVGELANITAPTETTTTQQASSKKKVTVICTKLAEQGLFPEALLYEREAMEHFEHLPDRTLAGYYAWANYVVSRMDSIPLICKHILLPIALSRYEMVIKKKFKFWGAMTIYVGQPVCYFIGIFALPRMKSNGNISR